MARPLAELRALQREHNGVPIFYAGDIFDRWNSPPELINFALEYLPKGYAVPGQHDLPHHAHEEIKRSAYWTLIYAGHLIDLPWGTPYIDNAWYDIPVFNDDCYETMPVVYGFPWGRPIKPVVKMIDDYGRPIPKEGVLKVAIAHAYVWTDDANSYTGAPGEAKIGHAYPREWCGYDAVVFGDNHKGFLLNEGRGFPAVLNCGGFMRRKADEVDYRPGVGLLHADGSVTRHYLDTTEDEFTVYTDAEERVAEHLDMNGFMNELRDLEAGDPLNFEAAIEKFIRDNDVSERVARVILEAQEE